MKELTLFCVAVLLSFVHANPNGLNQVTEFTANDPIVNNLQYDLLSDGNTLIEIDLLKDYFPASGHVIRKRNVLEPPQEEPQTVQRRRRRRKKVPGGSGGNPAGNAGPEIPLPTPTAADSPMNSPLVNVLDPSDVRQRRRRPRPQPPTEPAPIVPKEPVLSELRQESTNGLLHTKQLEANYVRTDQMRTNRLKADKVRADEIKARDVVVTGKRSKSSRPSTSEFIQPEPIYEQAGTQRFNSVLDGQIYEPQFSGQIVGQNYYGGLQSIPMYENTPPIQRLVRPRFTNSDQLFSQNIQSNSQFLQAPESSRFGPVDIPPAIQPLPEFSSARMLDQYARKALVPALSEFIAEEPLIQSASQYIRKGRLRTRNPSTAEQPGPANDFQIFDNLDVHFNTGTGGRPDAFDKTSKTYDTSVDPWYF